MLANLGTRWICLAWCVCVCSRCCWSGQTQSTMSGLILLTQRASRQSSWRRLSSGHAEFYPVRCREQWLGQRRCVCVCVHIRVLHTWIVSTSRAVPLGWIWPLCGRTLYLQSLHRKKMNFKGRIGNVSAFQSLLYLHVGCGLSNMTCTNSVHSTAPDTTPVRLTSALVLSLMWLARGAATLPLVMEECFVISAVGCRVQLLLASGQGYSLSGVTWFWHTSWLDILLHCRQQLLEHIIW